MRFAIGFAAIMIVPLAIAVEPDGTLGDDGRHAWRLYGSGLALDGDRLAIAHDLPPRIEFVERTSTGWISLGTATAPTWDNGHFGYDMALGGDHLVVSDLNGGTHGVDLIWMCTISQLECTQLNRGSLHDPQSENQYGFAVALRGDWLAIGDPDYNSGDGLVEVYHRTPTGWQSHTILENQQGADGFGRDLEFNDTGALLVLDPRWYGSFTTRGAVHAYELQGGAWERTGQLITGTNDRGGVGDLFDIDGEHMFTHTYRRTADDRVDLYQIINGEWTHTLGVDQPTGSDWRHLEFNAPYAVVTNGFDGAWLYDFSTHIETGTLPGFSGPPARSDMRTFIQQQEDVLSFYHFAQDIAIHDNELIIGDPTATTGGYNDGTVYTYDIPCIVNNMEDPPLCRPIGTLVAAGNGVLHD